jgi:hypothetical protein
MVNLSFGLPGLDSLFTFSVNLRSTYCISGLICFAFSIRSRHLGIYVDAPPSTTTANCTPQIIPASEHQNCPSPPRYPVPDRRAESANRAALPADDARIPGFMILRLTTLKASDATHIVLSSSLFLGLSRSSSSRLNIANSTSGTSRVNFSGSVSSKVFRNISSQDTHLISLNESPRSYRARTSQTTRQMISSVPKSPYPNIAASSESKILGLSSPGILRGSQISGTHGRNLYRCEHLWQGGWRAPSTPPKRTQ